MKISFFLIFSVIFDAWGPTWVASGSLWAPSRGFKGPPLGFWGPKEGGGPQFDSWLNVDKCASGVGGPIEPSSLRMNRRIEA